MEPAAAQTGLNVASKASEATQNNNKAQIQPETKREQRREFDLRSLEPARTVLHDCGYRLPAVTYRSVDWKLFVRKEVM